MTKTNKEKDMVLKTSLPTSLKLKFKIICTAKKITMRSAVYNLINEWVQTESDEKFCSQPKLVD